MKIKIHESGEKVGWYNLDNDEYEYNGENELIEQILSKAKGFTTVTDVENDNKDVVGGEVWEESPEKVKSEQIENLLEPFDKVEIKKASYQVLEVEDGIVEKRRIYVDNEAEAPEWATVEEGPQDGLYYETQSSVDEGVPQFLDVSYAEESEVLVESSDDQQGRYAASMKVHKMPSGQRVYSKKSGGNHMVGEIMSDRVIEAFGEEAPAVAFDPEEYAVYKEGIPGDTIGQISGTATSTSRTHRDPDDLNADSYMEQVALMILTGNDDLNSGNLLADDSGDFWIVDHDNLGKRNMEYYPNEAGALTEAAIDYANSMKIGDKVSRDKIKEKVREMASRVVDENGDTTEEFQEALAQAGDHGMNEEDRPDMNEGITQSIQETIQMNVKAAINEELEWTGY